MLRRDELDVLPRLGWVAAPTPVTPLPELAKELGLGWLGAKRDDLCAELHGGTKVRKLDFALAEPRFADADQWASVGAIGSGHLATLTAAAEEQGRRLLAFTFWEPLGEWILENLAFTASGPTELRYFSSRVALALRHPRSLVEGQVAGCPVVVPGVSSPTGIIGMVRAGLELAEQIHSGELPEIDRIYVPLGSGGTAVGLSLGLALAGLRPRIHAVSAVERFFARSGRLEALSKRTVSAIRAGGVSLPKRIVAAPIHIDRRMLGRGYGHATAASLHERESLSRFGVNLEPVYGGKAMAALHADARNARDRVLFWHTPHRGTLPAAQGWEERLPPRLRRALEAAAESPEASPLGRRRWVALGAATLVGGVLGARMALHSSVVGWEGHTLFEWEGAVLAAAAEALVPDEPGGVIPGGVSPDDIACHVDRYILGMTDKMRTEVHGLFALVEHGTALDGNFSRFTRLDPAARRAFVEALAQHDDELGQAAKGLRDFTYLGYYQDARAWPAIGYRGPWVGPVPSTTSRYDALVAPVGTTPPRTVGGSS